MGQGWHPLHVGEVWYLFNGRQAYIRSGAAVRLGSPGQVRPVVTIDYSHNVRGDQLSICGIAPNGTCREYFPATHGPSIGLGVRALLQPRTTIGVGVGVAFYESTAGFAEAEMAVRLTRRVHALVHVRQLKWRDEELRLWFRPVTVGVRLQ